MGLFNSLNETSSKAVEKGEDYIKITSDYYQLKAFQQITKGFSFLGKIALIGGLFFLGLILFFVASTIWLGKELSNYPLACILVGLTVFLLALVIYWKRTQLIDNKIIKKLSEDFFD